MKNLFSKIPSAKQVKSKTLSKEENKRLNIATLLGLICLFVFFVGLHNIFKMIGLYELFVYIWAITKQFIFNSYEKIL
jgi:hypothetical protein